MSKQVCKLCPKYCQLAENEIGFCRSRSNIDGKIVPINYGLITSLALDPIEKKPLMHFFQGSNILSIGSFGCNLRCSFCQNNEISMKGINETTYKMISPDELVSLALWLSLRGNIGIAYTYNEPLISFEYIKDCAIAAREKGLKNVIITNGCFNENYIKEILPYIDAFNIDLKGFTPDFYKKVNGDLETVKRTIEIVAKATHLEVSTLVIPGENDDLKEMKNLAQWLSSIDSGIPLHLSRFFPSYQMMDREPTPVKDLLALKNVAKEYLDNVYLGNC